MGAHYQAKKLNFRLNVNWNSNFFPLERKVENFVPLANLSRGKQQPDTKLLMLSDISFGYLLKKDVKVISTASFQQMVGWNP